MLDLPPGLDRGDVLSWRRRLASDRAALYAPYVLVPPLGEGEAEYVSAPPGAIACGVVAAREQRLGVQAAPATGALSNVAALRPDAYFPEAGFLHQSRVNAIRATEAGFELLGSRTTSMDRTWTHLSVRRLVDHIALQVAMDSRWAVFEPNDETLRGQLVTQVEQRLTAFWNAGAFKGRDPSEAFFVRPDDTVPFADQADRGRVVILIGICPSVPMEFLVFRLVRSDAGATVEQIRG